MLLLAVRDPRAPKRVGQYSLESLACLESLTCAASCQHHSFFLIPHGTSSTTCRSFKYIVRPFGFVIRHCKAPLIPNGKSDSLFEQKHLDVLLFLLEAQAAWELCAIAHPFRRSHAMARNPSIAAESMSWMINETIRRTRELHFPLQSWSATEMHFSVF